MPLNSNLRSFPVSDDIDRRLRYHFRQQRNARIGHVLLVLAIGLLAAVCGWVTTDNGQAVLDYIDKGSW